jgi:hypothetical protein
MSFHKIIRDAVFSQFGSEIKAGLHSEYPRLKELCLEAEAERAEQAALEQACFQVLSHGDSKAEN